MIRKVASPKLLQKFIKTYKILPSRHTIPMISMPICNYSIFPSQRFWFSDQKNQKNNDKKSDKDKDSK